MLKVTTHLLRMATVEEDPALSATSFRLEVDFDSYSNSNCGSLVVVSCVSDSVSVSSLTLVSE